MKPINARRRFCILVLSCSLVIQSLTAQAWAETQAAESAQAAAAARVDGWIEARLQQEGVQAAEIAGDEEFCRRVWLDLAGVAPPVNQLRRFLADDRPDKRERLIDQLLASSRHAEHMATRWNRILLPPAVQTELQRAASAAALQQWLREQFQANVPYDYLVADFLTAGGDGNEGPAIFYTARDLEPEKIAAASSQIFLGIQLQCAQCHDHPFDRWTQKDFWSYAAFFSQVQQTETPMRRQAVIEDRPGMEVTLPGSDQVMPPRYPGIDRTPEPDPGNHRRRQLTIWLASKDNPYFARAAANRVWQHLFGRGLVHPVDQMDADNPASHPELLTYLADYLVEQRFDLRKLYAMLARTRTYHRSSRFEGAAPPEHLFAGMMVKTLTPEQFFDTLQQNVLRDLEETGPQDESPNPLVNPSLRQQFVRRMQSTIDDPAQYPHGVVQALSLINGPEVTRATDTAQLGLLTALQAPFFDDSQRLETLYLATLSRLPTAHEREWMLPMLSGDSAAGSEAETTDDETARQQAMSDVLWALLNSAEFATCP